MKITSQERIAKVKLTLTKRTVEALKPGKEPWIAWDDKLTGFGVRVQPTGTKAFIVNYGAGNGGRKAPNKRVVIARQGRMTPNEATRFAQELLGRVAGGGDPAAGRADARGVPTPREAFAEYLAADPDRKAGTERLYRGQMRYALVTGGRVDSTRSPEGMWRRVFFSCPSGTVGVTVDICCCNEVRFSFPTAASPTRGDLRFRC